MALWNSKQPDLQSRIDDIQTGLAALAGLLGDGASAAGKGAARGTRRAGDAASEAAHDVSAQLSPVLNDLKSQLDGAIASASALTGRAAGSGRRAYRAVETRVEDNPMMAVLAAAGVGFLIGSMLVGGAASRMTAGTQQPPRRAAAKSRTRGRSRGRKSA